MHTKAAVTGMEMIFKIFVYGFSSKQIIRISAERSIKKII